MTIFYRLENKLYVNITNTCPCACVFCIRNFADTVGDAPSLWLKREPTPEEVKEAFLARNDLYEVDEIVFCGYGEPMTRPNDVIEIAKYIKKATNLPLRLNTNGLVKLISPDFDMSLLKVMDSISVSMNANDPEEYLRIVQPLFGKQSYRAMLEFAQVAVQYSDVILTVLDDLGKERIEHCRQIASEIGASFRVRDFM